MVEKKFDPEAKTTKKILVNDTRLVIPRFQRTYAWKSSNLQDFYIDFIKTSQNEHQTFLGTLVLDASKRSHLEVIDGQQRILTLTIIFSVIRDMLREDLKTAEAFDLASIIHNNYILTGPSIYGSSNGTSDEGGSIYTLTASKDMREYFEDAILKGEPSLRQKLTPKREGEKNALAAYNFFRSEIKRDKFTVKTTDEDKVSILRRLTQSILDIEFITIDVYDSDMAYALFESHNAKGADLLISDLVKSYFYGQLRGSEDIKERQVKKWDAIVENLKNSAGIKIDKFLHYYQQSYEGRFTKAALYKKIKNSIGSSETNALSFIKKLRENTNLLLQLKSGEIESTPTHALPYETKEKINKSLIYIAEFRVDQCYILLLSLFRNRDKFTPTILKNYVELVENFTFIYSKISKGQANVLESVYAEHAELIEVEDHSGSQQDKEKFSGRMFSKLKTQLEQYVQYDFFEPKFKDLSYEKPLQKKLIQYSFAKIESHMNKGGTVLGLDSNIDHIAAQNPKIDQSKIANLHNIGNLVPIDKYSNSKLGNLPVTEKVEKYKELQNISMVRDLIGFLEANNYVIDDDSIDSRGRALASYAYNEVWKI